jgi:hypothetical protein
VCLLGSGRGGGRRALNVVEVGARVDGEHAVPRGVSRGAALDGASGVEELFVSPLVRLVTLLLCERALREQAGGSGRVLLRACSCLFEFLFAPVPEGMPRRALLQPLLDG